MPRPETTAMALQGLYRLSDNLHRRQMMRWQAEQAEMVRQHDLDIQQQRMDWQSGEERGREQREADRLAEERAAQVGAWSAPYAPGMDVQNPLYAPSSSDLGADIQYPIQTPSDPGMDAQYPVYAPSEGAPTDQGYEAPSQGYGALSPELQAKIDAAYAEPDERTQFYMWQNINSEIAVEEERALQVEMMAPLQFLADNLRTETGFEGPMTMEQMMFAAQIAPQYFDLDYAFNNLQSRFDQRQFEKRAAWTFSEQESSDEDIAAFFGEGYTPQDIRQFIDGWQAEVDRLEAERQTAFIGRGSGGPQQPVGEPTMTDAEAAAIYNSFTGEDLMNVETRAASNNMTPIQYIQRYWPKEATDGSEQRRAGAPPEAYGYMGEYGTYIPPPPAYEAGELAQPIEGLEVNTLVAQFREQIIDGVETYEGVMAIIRAMPLSDADREWIISQLTDLAPPPPSPELGGL